MFSALALQWARVVTDSHTVPCLPVHCPSESPLHLSLPPVFILLVFLVTAQFGQWVSISLLWELVRNPVSAFTPTSRIRNCGSGPRNLCGDMPCRGFPCELGSVHPCSLLSLSLTSLMFCLLFWFFQVTGHPRNQNIPKILVCLNVSYRVAQWTIRGVYMYSPVFKNTG